MDYEELPALFDVRLGFDGDAPVINDTFGNWYDQYEGNLDVRQIRKGDIDAAMDAADLIVSGVYRTQSVEQVPLETQVCVAIPEPDGASPSTPAPRPCTSRSASCARTSSCP